MKISVLCESPLLQKTFKNFLGTNLYKEDESDILIADYKIETKKEFILVSNTKEADLKKPFTKEELFDILNLKFEKLKKFKQNNKAQNSLKNDKEKIMEQRLRNLTNQYIKKVLQIVKESNG